MDASTRGARTVGIVATAILVACTSSTSRRADPLDLASPAAPSPSPAAPVQGSSPSTPSEPAGISGRLAVLDDAGHLVTMSPDGSGRVVLAEVDAGLTQIRQPSWSRDGSRVAWVSVGSSGPDTSGGLIVTATHDGRRTTETTTEVLPYYLNWDPTSSRIAYLGGLAPDEVGFGVVEPGTPAEETIVDSGRPFYFSWAPSGDELLVHVGEDRLDRLPLRGLPRPIDTPGIFSAPVWTADGETFVYGSRDEVGAMQLVAHDVERGDAEPLVSFDGLILFVVSPDGQRIAYQIVGQVETGPLTVLDLATGEAISLVDHLTAAFFWSPDSERLLYLDPQPTPEAYWYRWGVWDGASTFETPRFVPSLLMVGDYFPFFEQYAQSMSLWSPDGRAFAYPGTGEDGRTGIWVQEALPDRAPVLVSDGEFVTWSPA